MNFFALGEGPGNLKAPPCRRSFPAGESRGPPKVRERGLWGSGLWGSGLWGSGFGEAAPAALVKAGGQ